MHCYTVSPKSSSYDPSLQPSTGPAKRKSPPTSDTCPPIKRQASSLNSVPQEKLTSLKEQAEKLYGICIGAFIDETQFNAKADQSGPKIFKEGDLAVVSRSKKRHQYVVVLKQNEKDIYFYDSAFIRTKEVQYFYKVLAAEEKLTPTQPLPSQDYEATSSLPPETLDHAMGTRSLNALQFVAYLNCNSSSGHKLNIQGINYYILSSKIRSFTTKPLASCGSSKYREILLLNPKNCPHLNKHFEKLKQKILDLQEDIGVPLTTRQLLNVVNRYTKEIIFFANKGPTIHKIDKIVQEALNDPSVEKFKHSEFTDVEIPAVSIERFVAKGVGVCRHTSLTVCYLLDRLSRELFESHLLGGIVQHRREDLPIGPHSWTTFVPKTKLHKPPQRWLIDAQFGIVENFAKQKGLARLGIYGDALDSG